MFCPNAAYQMYLMHPPANLNSVVWCGAVRCSAVWCGVVWCVVGTEGHTTPHPTPSHTTAHTTPHHTTPQLKACRRPYGWLAQQHTEIGGADLTHISDSSRLQCNEMHTTQASFRPVGHVGWDPEEDSFGLGSAGAGLPRRGRLRCGRLVQIQRVRRNEARALGGCGGENQTVTD